MRHSHGIHVSMDDKRCWRYNVFIESAWRSSKYEEVYLHTCETVSAPREGIGCGRGPIRRLRIAEDHDMDQMHCLTKQVQDRTALIADLFAAAQKIGYPAKAMEVQGRRRKAAWRHSQFMVEWGPGSTP